MRKFFAIMLAVALITPFSIGCGDKKTDTKKKETTVTTDADKDDKTKTTTTEKTDKTTVEGDRDDTDPTKK